MELLNSAQDWMNGDDGEKRRQEQIRQMRMDRAREDRLRGLAQANTPNTFATNSYYAARALESPHFGQQNAMIRAVNSVVDDEMDSRVAQAREARRMEHEQELMRMRMQVERERAQIEMQKTEALLRRLSAQEDRQSGVISRIRTGPNGRLTFG